MQQLELDFDTPITKAAKHAFTIGFVRGTKYREQYVDNKTLEAELQLFLKQLEGTHE